MPLELQIIRASEFVRLGARDHLDFETSKAALALLAGACRKRGLDVAMLDLRELPIGQKPFFTSSELAALVNTFRAAGFAKRQKLAILYKTDPHHGARLFSFLGRLKGWQVRAFSEFEDALGWLSTENSESVDDDPVKEWGTADRGKINIIFKKEGSKPVKQKNEITS